MEDVNDIELIIKKGSPLVVIESYEEPRVLELCTRLAIKTFTVLYSWRCTTGLQNGVLDSPPVGGTSADHTSLENHSAT